ncbi:hypothetical protein [Pseudocolwellia sp. HL-MZ7]|uniref:hypothetical protein n=1 Tax=Pseudocolwellia sp. HL-MZ7 TaxID=3400627 RepID=UPI003CE79A10
MSEEKTKTIGIYYKDTIYLERLGAVRDLLRAAKKQLTLSLHQGANVGHKQTDVASYVYQIDDHTFFSDEIKTHFLFPDPEQAFLNGQAPMSDPGDGSMGNHRSFITTVGDQKYLTSKVIATTLRLSEVIFKMKRWNSQSHMYGRYSIGNISVPLYILSKDGFIIKTTYAKSYTRWSSIEAVNE